MVALRWAQNVDIFGQICDPNAVIRLVRDTASLLNLGASPSHGEPQNSSLPRRAQVYNGAQLRRPE
jgi:hypothetical protein